MRWKQGSGHLPLDAILPNRRPILLRTLTTTKLYHLFQRIQSEILTAVGYFIIPMMSSVQFWNTEDYFEKLFYNRGPPNIPA
ncbi:UNVERIFIED_CONTAM: hypothetical protein RMT77_017345 [Armadillidium vulgare]